MKIKRLILLITSILTIATVCPATAPHETEQPVRWRMSVRMESADRGTVTLRALIEPGWHLYGTKLPADGPQHTVFDFKESYGITFTSQLEENRAATESVDQMFGSKLCWWDSNVSFTRTFKVNAPDDAGINVKISFMGCDNTTCLPPRTNTFSYKITQKAKE